MSDFREQSDLELMGGSAQFLPSSARDCPYLDARVMSDEAYVAFQIPPSAYHELMNRNYRRSGIVVYRPRCADCTLCRQIRVPVVSFRPSRSQRRASARNRDITVALGRPRLTEEKYELYRRYLAGQHSSSTMSDDPESLHQFLYTSNVATIEVEYRSADGVLVAVSILDVCEESFSSVYHFFDPEEGRRSLGVFSVVAEIGLAREHGIPYYYLGYWIDGCRTMDYKADYRPHEVLIAGEWHRVD